MARVRLEAGAIPTEVSTDGEDGIEEVTKVATTCQDWQFSQWASVDGQCVRTEPSIFEL